MLIQSTRNPTVKLVRSLLTKKGRRETGLHLIEGERLVAEAVSSGAEIDSLFVEEGREPVYCPNGSVYQVTRHVLESMTDTDNPQSVCAAVKTPDIKLLDEYPEGLIVAMDCVQDPGNMGTIIRTADAMGAAGLLLSSGCADPFGPKVLRSTMGSIYHLPIWQGELAAELVKLKSEDFRLICRCVLIIGNEGNGVSDAVAELCDKYRLPMFGRAESLNASVAAGIMMYEIAKEMRK